jgi:hypothetical protein
MSTRTRSLLTCGAAALTLALAPANRDPVQAATQHVVSLSGPRVSVIDAAHLVVSLEAKGDIRGLLTLTIDRGGSAAALKGDWALVSRYGIDLNGANQEVRADEQESLIHQERFAIKDRGTLNGLLNGGTLVFDGAGRLTGIEGLQLSISGGAIEFAKAAGSGSRSAANLQDAYGTGTLTLAQEVR